MKTAYSWLFRSIVGSLAALVLAQSLLVALGLPLILNAYSRYRQAEFATLAREIIRGDQDARERAQGMDGGFFVFSADRNLIYSNRGKGKSLPETDLVPIAYDNAVVGYYRALELQFLDSQANRLFFATLVMLLGGSIVVSSAIGLFFAYRSAGKISRPVKTLLEDLHGLEQLKPVPARSFEIRELTDISERMQKVGEMLSRQDSYKRRWMQDISHDLRTPITGLRGQLEGLRDGVFKPSPERYARLLSEIGRLESMASGVSELYYLENGSTLSVDDIDAAEFLEETLRPFEHAIAEKKLVIAKRFELPAIRGDRQLLLRAAGNVLSNALRFVPDGGGLEIGIESAEEGWTLTVYNDGPAIPGDQLPRIFERFYRGENSRTTPGSGLGLNIVREIARRHGGRVAAENVSRAGAAPGQGSGVRFILNVPWLEGPPKP